MADLLTFSVDQQSEMERKAYARHRAWVGFRYQQLWRTGIATLLLTRILAIDDNGKFQAHICLECFEYLVVWWSYLALDFHLKALLDNKFDRSRPSGRVIKF
jgi:hypothetical protein